MIQINRKFNTGGDGYWSSKVAPVTATKMELGFFGKDESGAFGELRVYFDTTDWNVDQDGLIYSDGEWAAEFGQFLFDCSFTQNGVSDISYSEQGMQGNDYVSLDVGDTFLTEFRRLFPKEVE